MVLVFRRATHGTAATSGASRSISAYCGDHQQHHSRRNTMCIVRQIRRATLVAIDRHQDLQSSREHCYSPYVSLPSNPRTKCHHVRRVGRTVCDSMNCMSLFSSIYHHSTVSLDVCIENGYTPVRTSLFIFSDTHELVVRFLPLGLGEALVRRKCQARAAKRVNAHDAVWQFTMP